MRATLNLPDLRRPQSGGRVASCSYRILKTATPKVPTPDAAFDHHADLSSIDRRFSLQFLWTIKP
jgi:hypothetical protein